MTSSTHTKSKYTNKRWNCYSLQPINGYLTLKTINLLNLYECSLATTHPPSFMYTLYSLTVCIIIATNFQEISQRLPWSIRQTADTRWEDCESLRSQGREGRGWKREQGASPSPQKNKKNKKNKKKKSAEEVAMSREYKCHVLSLVLELCPKDVA